jgi:glycosyltransferase involved in cell wall biosynthesis
MKIAAVCPTHGRGHIIGEAVQSFLNQRGLDDDVRLVIVNDCPEQPLASFHPLVEIYNLPEPITDYSAKMNRSVVLADADLVMWWEDDDISLPWRLEWCRARMHTGYSKQAKAWVMDDGVLSGLRANLFFGNSCFRSDYYFSCGGATLGRPGDLTAHENMLAGGDGAVSWGEEHFIYKWGRADLHHDSTVAGTNADRFTAFRERTLAHPRFVPGPCVIEPRWEHDYAALVAERMNNENS